MNLRQLETGRGEFSDCRFLYLGVKIGQARS